MSNYLRHRLKILLISIVVLLTIIISYVSIVFTKDPLDNHVNECRVLVSTIVNDIESKYKNNELGELKAQKYEYAITDLKGNVIKASEDSVKSIDLKADLAFDSQYKSNNDNLIKYSTTLSVDNEVKGFITLIIPKKDVLNFNRDKTIFKWIPVAILVLILIYLIYTVYKTIKIDILNAIEGMHFSAKKILSGDYSAKVSYDYDGEIGEFSHDFEAMRDGLKVAKESEERLKKAEKELIASISHDLKTPIATISGYCEGILDGVVKDEESIKRYASIILKKSKVLTKLIDDMLEYSKAEINQMTINRSEVYSQKFFMEMFEDISMDAVSSGRKFELEGNIENVLISIDKVRISEVVNNLVSNAIKYTEKDGVIKVNVENLEEYIRVRVMDNGIGIGADELPYVFNKFYRGEKHRNLDIPGSGLGLSISKYIVEKHGGKISIKSDKAAGTEVGFTLKKL